MAGASSKVEVSDGATAAKKPKCQRAVQQPWQAADIAADDEDDLATLHKVKPALHGFAGFQFCMLLQLAIVIWAPLSWSKADEQESADTPADTLGATGDGQGCWG